MVQLTEVVDEHFKEGQPGLDDEDDFTDTDSEVSTESDYDPAAETLAERLFALRDIVPPQTRGAIAGRLAAAAGTVGSLLSFGGRALWVLSSSALFISVPWALAWAEEVQILELEKETKMREQGGQLLNEGKQDADSGGGQGENTPATAKAAL